MWAPHGMHTPLQAPTAYTDKFANLPNDATFSATDGNIISRGNYAAIVNSVDDQFGLVVKALKEKGMVRRALPSAASLGAGRTNDTLHSSSPRSGKIRSSSFQGTTAGRWQRAPTTTPCAAASSRTWTAASARMLG